MGHHARLRHEETANDLIHELSRIEKSRHFVYMRALITHSVREITLKIPRSKDAQCKTEESP